MASQTPLATPSAKAHERVTGRWNRKIQVEGSTEQFFYFMKHIFGTPAVALLPVFVFSMFLSRAALEISTWAFAVCVLVYIVADRFSRTKEFTGFRFGTDLALLGYLLVGIISISAFESWPDALGGLSTLRWVLLAYIIIFGLDLFPGVNRLYFFMMGGASLVSCYALFQHFAGFDQVRGGNLQFAPVKGHAFFQAIGFFSSPRILPTLLAMAIPFPAAAYLFAEKRAPLGLRWSLLPLICLFSLALLWTYQPGLWVAGFAGAVALMILQFRRQISLFGTVAVFLVAVLFIAYDSPQNFIEQIQNKEDLVAAVQRAELGKQLNAFSESPLIGNGPGSSVTEKFDRDHGSLYFQILAETGIIGLAMFFIFVLGSLLSAYRLLQEIPNSFYWHRALVAGTLGSQIAFLAAGLHWPMIREPIVMYLFIFELAVISYLSEQYRRGLVSDDFAL